MADGTTGGGTGTPSGNAGGTAGGEGIAEQVAGALSDWAPAPEAGKEGEKAAGEGEKAVVKEEAKEVSKEKGSEESTESTELATLKGQIATLQSMITALAQGKDKVPEKKEEVKDEPFVTTQADMDKALDKPEEFHKLLTKVKASAKKEAIEEVLKNIPAVIDNLVKTQIELRGRVKDFYEEHKDLRDHKDFVGHTVNKLMGSNPGWNMSKVFEELPKEVRKSLGLKQQASTSRRGPVTPQKGGGARMPAQQDSGELTLQDEIAELIQL